MYVYCCGWTEKITDSEMLAGAEWVCARTSCRMLVDSIQNFGHEKKTIFAFRKILFHFCKAIKNT